jgi:hypothetical protein
LILLCIVAMLAVTSCSDDDNNVMAPPTGAAAAEAAIEDALDSVIDPLVTLLDFIVDYLSVADGATDGLACPDTTGACNPGSLTCTDGIPLQFDFSGCSVVGASPALSVDGNVDYTPSTIPPWGGYLLGGLSVNGSTGLNGTVTLTDDCNWSWNITADDGTVTNASLVLCTGARGTSEYPLGESSLSIFSETSAGFVSAYFTFDGTQTASVMVFLDETLTAQCTVDLETFDATCTDADV